MSEDVLSLEIEGVSFSGWEGISVSSALNELVPSFSLSAPFDHRNEALRRNFKPFKFQRADLKIDGELLLAGIIESASFSLSGSDSKVNVQGRGKTGALIDCYVDDVKYQAQGIPLSGVIRQLVAPFGFALMVEKDSPVISEVKIDPGTRVFDAISKICADYSLILTSTPEGMLKLTTIKADAVPVASIIEGEDMLLGIEASYDGASRFSRFKVLQQHKDENVTASAEDRTIKEYRPHVSVGAETDTKDLSNAAAWNLVQAFNGSFGLSLSVSGWRDNRGRLFRAGDKVILKAPSVYILKETEMVIIKETKRLDADNGRTTEMSLSFPSAYSSRMPEVFPWD